MNKWDKPDTLKHEQNGWETEQNRWDWRGKTATTPAELVIPSIHTKHNMGKFKA
jgi:hypothetical protein